MSPLTGYIKRDGHWGIPQKMEFGSSQAKKGSKIIKANGATIEEALLRAAEQARLAVEMN